MAGPVDLRALKRKAGDGATKPSPLLSIPAAEGLTGAARTSAVLEEIVDRLHPKGPKAPTKVMGVVREPESADHDAPPVKGAIIDVDELVVAGPTSSTIEITDVDVDSTLDAALSNGGMRHPTPPKGIPVTAAADEFTDPLASVVDSGEPDPLPNPGDIVLDEVHVLPDEEAVTDLLGGDRHPTSAIPAAPAETPAEPVEVEAASIAPRGTMVIPVQVAERQKMQ